MLRYDVDDNPKYVIGLGLLRVLLMILQRRADERMILSAGRYHGADVMFGDSST
jgi:hypothetical protein